MTERDNIMVFEDTMRQTLEKYMPDEEAACYYNGLEPLPARESLAPITMVHGGIVNTGYAFAGDMSVAILNFAGVLKFGGWVEDGAQESLNKHNNNVDYITTHCCGTSLVPILLSLHHRDKRIDDKYTCDYNRILQIK